MNNKVKQYLTAFSRLWSQNWKTATAVGLAIIILLVVLLVPLARVPVEAIETYYDTETRLIPVRETIIAKEPYTEPVYKERTLRDDMLVVNPDTYVILPQSLDLSNKVSPLVCGNFISLDGRSILFMVFDHYPYRVHPSAYLPAPIYQTRLASGDFKFTPSTSEYYLVLDNYTYTQPRLFKLYLGITWTEMTVKYRDVPREQTVYRQVEVEVPKQRKVISHERKSLFQLLTSPR